MAERRTVVGDIVREGLNMATEQISLQKGRHQISAGVDIRFSGIERHSTICDVLHLRGES